MKIENPLIVCFENDGNIRTIRNPGKRGHQQYGILIADIVRHVSNAFKVDENDVWEWVDKERYNPTSPVTELKPN